MDESARRFLDSVYLGRIDEVRALLDAGVDVDTDDDHKLALTCAIEQGHVDVAALLWDRGAGERARTEAFQAAVEDHREDLVDWFLARGQDVDARHQLRYTALSIAARRNLRLTRRLLAAGADPNGYKAIMGQTCLSEAATRGSVEIVEVLLAAGADPTVQLIDEPYYHQYVYSSIAEEASKRGYPDCAVALGAPAPAHTEAAAACSAALDAALEAGDADAAFLCLSEALERRYTRVWRRAPDVLGAVTLGQESMNALLELAAERRFAVAANALLTYGAEVGEWPWPLSPFVPPDMLQAAKMGKKEIWQAKNLNLPVDARDEDGATPLHHAWFVGITDCLVRFGAEVNARRNDGATPLHVAAADYYPKAERLIAAGADPDATDARGWTPLMVAAAHSKAEVVERLLAAGADASLTNDEGMTAGAIAARGSATSVLGLLRAAHPEPEHEPVEPDRPSTLAELEALIRNTPGGLPIFTVMRQDDYDKDLWTDSTYVSMRRAEARAEVCRSPGFSAWVNRQLVTEVGTEPREGRSPVGPTSEWQRALTLLSDPPTTV